MRNVDSAIETQNIISMCPGIGGIERGLARASVPIRTLCYVEIEAFIVANMVAQMEVGLLDAAPVWTNLKTFDGKPFRGLVHGITAGYPCQPFSNAGKRGGVDDERHLWPYIHEQIKIIGPEWVYFENVAGHLSMGYAEVRRSLCDLGYRVEEGIFTAEEVGAPHRRERLFILGVMENACIVRWRRGRTGGTPGRERKIQITGSSAALEQSRVGQANPASPGQQITRSAASSELPTEDGAGLDNRPEQFGYELANTNGYDSRTEYGHVPCEQGTCPSEEYQRERMRGELGSFDTEVAYSGSSRNEAGIPASKQREEGVSRKFDDCCDEHRFPAGQGVYQHPWEQPRTIESGMVYTIDGHNFTEDLHRAIGNSVVEQVAELAFLTLLDKHIKNSTDGR